MHIECLWSVSVPTICVPICADGPRCHSGQAAERLVHAAENGNPHSPAKTRREGDGASQLQGAF